MKKTIFTILLFLMVSSVYADMMKFPARGTSMDEVLSQSGEPEKKLDAVGQPPITRWIYQDYTVYFEHQTVIHSVKNDS